VNRRPSRFALAAALAALSLAALPLASCRKEEAPASSLSPETPDGGGRAETTDGEIIYSETLDLGGRSLFVMSSFPRTGIRAIDDYYEAETASFKAAAAALADDLREEQSPQLPLEYSESSEIVRDGGGVFSVRREIYIYTGGIHANYYTVCDNFRLPDGGRLALDDVFAVPREEYAERLLAFFGAFIDADADVFFPDAKDTLRESFPYEMFCVTDGGLEFYFPPYVIGPYSSGTIVIPVPASEIADIADAAIFPPGG
jgi:hypothetical protein